MDELPAIYINKSTMNRKEQWNIQMSRLAILFNIMKVEIEKKKKKNLSCYPENNLWCYTKKKGIFKVKKSQVIEVVFGINIFIC